MPLRVLFIAAMTLLPIGLTMGFIWSRATAPGGSDYWNVAPWFLLPAIAMGLVTCTIATVAVSAYDHTVGSWQKKRAMASAWYFGLCGALAFVVVKLVADQRRDEQFARELARQAESFVQAHPEVIEAVGSDPRVAVLSTTGPSFSPTYWTVAIDGKGRRGAFVRFVSKGNPQFELVCITSEPKVTGEPERDCERSGTAKK